MKERAKKQVNKKYGSFLPQKNHNDSYVTFRAGLIGPKENFNNFLIIKMALLRKEMERRIEVSKEMVRELSQKSLEELFELVPQTLKEKEHLERLDRKEQKEAILQNLQYSAFHLLHLSLPSVHDILDDSKVKERNATLAAKRVVEDYFKNKVKWI